MYLPFPEIEHIIYTGSGFHTYVPDQPIDGSKAISDPALSILRYIVCSHLSPSREDKGTPLSPLILEQMFLPAAVIIARKKAHVNPCALGVPGFNSEK